MPKRGRFHNSNNTRNEPFQPLRTLLHIALLQGIYYLTATLLILFTTLVAGEHFSVALIMSWRAVRGDTTVGWTLGVVWCLCAVVMIIVQLLVISRSKLVLDFSLTISFLHLLIVSLYEHEIPRSVLWWVLQVVQAVIMVVGGTWACRWRELRPMSFGFGGRAEEGLDRRGRVVEAGRGGSEEYELVAAVEEGEGSIVGKGSG